jgi:CRISPR type I-E-associated protein CasA/Cse1
MVAGSSLFETLMFNLLVYDPDNRAPIAGSSAKDSPAWERPALPRPEGTKEPKRTPFGWLDRLTWQSRRLELDVDEERGSVRGVIYCVGQGLDDDASPAPEPMLAYVLQGKPAVLRSVDFAEERAVWRDCHALIRKASADGAERAPMAVRQLARVEVRRVLGGRRQRLWLLGMRGDQARVKLVREEVLTIPLSVVCDESKTSAVEEALRLAEEVGKALRWSVRDAVRSTLAPGERDPDKEDVSRNADALGSERGYWATLSGAFEVFLDGLEHDSPDCARRFVEQARAAAESSLIRATEALGSSARQLQGGARASRALRHRLDELVANTGGTP